MLVTLHLRSFMWPIRPCAPVMLNFFRLIEDTNLIHISGSSEHGFPLLGPLCPQTPVWPAASRHSVLSSDFTPSDSLSLIIPLNFPLTPVFLCHTTWFYFLQSTYYVVELIKLLVGFPVCLSPPSRGCTRAEHSVPLGLFQCTVQCQEGQPDTWKDWMTHPRALVAVLNFLNLY